MKFNALQTLLLVAFVAVSLTALRVAVRPYYVASASMAPTLQLRDVVLVARRDLLPWPLCRDEVVLMTLPEPARVVTRVPPGARVLKRVVGLPGDVVELRAGVGLLRNGSLLDPSGGDGPAGDESVKLVEGRLVRVLADGSVWRLDDGGVLRAVDDPEEARAVAAAPAEPLPSGRVFVVGDNRERSVDSLTWGPLDASCVVGRVVAVVYPRSRTGTSLARPVRTRD